MGDMGVMGMVPEEGMAGKGECLAAPFFRFVKKTHRRTWFSNASFEVLRGLCLKIQLVRGGAEEANCSRKIGDRHRLLFNVLEVMGVVTTAYYAILVMRKDTPARRERGGGDERG